MNKLVEMLKKLLPADSMNEVAEAVDQLMAEAKAELEAEFNTKLEEAYTELSQELALAEKTGEEGYQQAFAIITEQKNRMEKLREEYSSQLDEGYEDAYNHILAEREKYATLETRLYEEYDKKLNEMKTYIVEKVNQFLDYKGGEITEQLRRDMFNDPRYAQQKVAFDRIAEIVAGYLSDEDYAVATSGKLEEASRQVEELKGQLRLMEARNIRLSTDVTRLNETVRDRTSVITENQIHEKKERAKNSKNVSGRGRTVTTEQVEVIKEHDGKTAATNGDITLAEYASEFAELNVLAGVTQSK